MPLAFSTFFLTLEMIKLSDKLMAFTTTFRQLNHMHQAMLCTDNPCYVQTTHDSLTTLPELPKCRSYLQNNFTYHKYLILNRQGHTTTSYSCKQLYLGWIWSRKQHMHPPDVEQSCTHSSQQLSYLLLLLFTCAELTCLGTFMHSREMERKLYIIHFFIFFLCFKLFISFVFTLHLFNSNSILLGAPLYLICINTCVLRLEKQQEFTLQFTFQTSLSFQSHSHHLRSCSQSNRIFTQIQSLFVNIQSLLVYTHCYTSRQLCLVLGRLNL